MVVLVATAVAPRGAFAQAGSTTVTCLSSFDWMNNSLGQNPCLVASYLVSECLNATLGIDPGPIVRPGPFIENTPNDCSCSTVAYSMFSACGTCQNATIDTWNDWTFNCPISLTHYSEYPLNIPNGTAVPHWAYLDVVTNNTFNATAAQQDGDSPESTSTQVQFTTSIIIYSTTSVSASLTSSSTTQSPSSTAKSSNVKAIAGGVVGGVIAVITIAGIVAWFFVRRRHSTKASSAAFGDSSVGPGCTPSVYMRRELRLCDPDDPSTFPTSPPSGTTPTTIDNVYQKPSIPSHVYSYSTGTGRYSGAPEL
ncbi:hypothetical protein K503DRAFT_777517 [Rhizopogon vinicolor AM-OR11-026]|uniref:Mid2 domain-containing protein n=1 Tax=Rhizopogon vinicolor AM-OR11-026 TaxID=1314800 RepID=A0A1B7MFY0_9AGAM|nr:hypothetical protein K503DRAFT_777517 [Rhizopogon vinicolor AM-OR11-026]